MRIVVNDIAASKTGALSILKDFYNYIREHDKSNEWIFVLGDEFLEETDNIKVMVRKDVKASRKNRLMFDLKTGAEYLSSLKPDVVFSLQNTMPKGYEGKQVVYVHQPLGYQKWKYFSFLNSYEREYAVYQYGISRMIDASVKRADKVIVQTEWMKKAVVNKTHVAENKVVKIMPDIVIPEKYRYKKEEKKIDNSVIKKINDCEQQGITVDGYRKKYLNTGVVYGKDNTGLNSNVIHQKPEPKKFNKFFYPAGNILYKNHSCILDAVIILMEKGITDFTVSFTLEEGEATFLEDYLPKEQVKYLGKLSREEVFEKYKDEVLLFPSYIETFGYPPAEARAVGGLIFASDCDFCHEVLKGYANAYYFDPFGAEDLAILMEQAINGEIPILRPESAEAEDILEPENRNSWGQVVEEILKVARS